MEQIKEVVKMSILIDKDWYYDLDMTKVTLINEVSPEDIGKFIPLNELNDFTRKVLGERYNDPSDEAYRTPQQLAKLKIESMIEDQDIGGTLYNSDSGKILALDCDSDRYTLALQWFINLDKNEGFIG